MSAFVAVFVGGPLDGQRQQIENPDLALYFPRQPVMPDLLTEANIEQPVHFPTPLIYERRARFRMTHRPGGEYRYDFRGEK